jgi:sugar O-acyltransferase (sialic acid O-acetyltransferase NeuD family)
MKDKKVVIIGNGSNSRLAKYYFDTDSEYEVVAFSVNRLYITEEKMEGLPVVALEELSQLYPPETFSAFVAVGYSQMNKLRERLYNECKSMGYTLASYVSSRSLYLSQYPPGDNCFIQESNTIQRNVKIGNNVVIWCSNSVAHDAVIEDHCYITTNIAVSGSVTIKRNSFIGTNATLNHGITIEAETLIGAGAIIMKNTVEKGVYMPPRSVKISKKSIEMNIR